MRDWIVGIFWALVTIAGILWVNDWLFLRVLPDDWEQYQTLGYWIMLFIAVGLARVRWRDVLKL